MMRAPMSRMDVLTESEIHEINSKSKLVKKYSELIDRESAYEMLNKKISAEAQQAQEAEEQVRKEKEEQKPSEITGTVTKSVLKVLTSATFIRGAFGILSKILKK
jgi:hypothetical protein